MLGASTYKLYKVDGEILQLIYEGRERTVEIAAGAYLITSLNGNGESEKSGIRSTADRTTYWDNHPERGFVRDTRSFEHGFPGFDYINNPFRTILKYPSKEDMEEK